MYLDLEELKAQLGPESLSQLGKCTFAIIRPDAILRGIHSEVLGALSELGFKVVAFKIAYVDERQMEELYRFTQMTMMQNQMRPLWWLTRNMYSAFPAMLLLLTADRDQSGGDVAPRLDGLKGPANPVLTSPHHLRNRFRAVNPILCVLHSSDDADATLREARIFFTAEEVRAALHQIGGSKHSTLPSPDRYLLGAASRWRSIPPRPGSFVQILAILKIRMAADLVDWEDCGLDLGVLADLHEELFRIGAEGLPYSEEARRAHQVLDREAHVLKAVSPVTESAANDWRAGSDTINRLALFSLMVDLTNHGNFERISFIEMKQVLDRRGIYIDSWEALVVESSFVFHNVQLAGYSIPKDKAVAR
jgi:nucleoside diphosphate kinase